MAVDDKTLQPFGLGPRDLPAKPVELLRPNENTVTMVFPRQVILNTDYGKRVEFSPGVQEVPEHLADHQWLKLNGVLRYNAVIAKQALENAKSVADAEAALAVAQANLAAAKAAVVKTGLPQVSVADNRTTEQVDADTAEAQAEEEVEEAEDAPSKVKAVADLVAAKTKQATALRNAQQARRR